MKRMKKMVSEQREKERKRSQRIKIEKRGRDFDGDKTPMLVQRIRKYE